MRSKDRNSIGTIDYETKEGLFSAAVALSRCYLEDFVSLTFSAFQFKWYHKLLCSKLDDVITGKITRLMVFMPPQHSKTELVSRRFPAFLLGRDPFTKIASCTYSSDLAQKLNRDVQRIIDDELYRYIFPHTTLSGKSSLNVQDNSTYTRTTDFFEIVGYRGMYKSVGTGGPLTGNTVDYGIIDDPIKDAVEAHSQTYRNRVWEWYNDVFVTRMHNNSRQIITLTRWHEDDLAGRILSSEKDKWTIVSFPAIKEDDKNKDDIRKIGEALWPERHSLERILDIKSKSQRTFTSLYQQRPSPSEGALFKSHYWKYWIPKGSSLPVVSKKMPNGNFVQCETVELPEDMHNIIDAWDLSFNNSPTSARCSGQKWAIKDNKKYLLNSTVGLFEYVQSIEEIKKLKSIDQRTTAVLIEEAANGHAAISELRTRIDGVIGIKPIGSKTARALDVTHSMSVVAQCESGQLYLPHPMLFGWVDEFIEEFSMFPNGKYCDQVDATVHAIVYLSSCGGVMVTAESLLEEGFFE